MPLRWGYGELARPALSCLPPLNRSALVITEAELKLIAKAAIMGDRSHPVSGYNTPAASGTPSAL